MRKILFALLSLMLGCGALHAEERATQKQAMAITVKAVAFMKEHGKDKLIEAVNGKDPNFVQGDLYVVVLDLEGRHLAHPTNPKLIGQAMLDVPDADGKLFRKERVEKAKESGRGWVDYKYKNPATGQIEQKTAYIVKVNDVIISAGAYKDPNSKLE